MVAVARRFAGGAHRAGLVAALLGQRDRFLQRERLGGRWSLSRDGGKDKRAEGEREGEAHIVCHGSLVAEADDRVLAGGTVGGDDPERDPHRERHAERHQDRQG